MTSDRGTGSLKLVILDLDGVVYRGDEPVAGAVELVRRLRDAGVAVRYATNNSMSTRDEFARRLRDMGIAATADEIVTSVSATIDYLARHAPEVHAVMTVGARGMVQELREAGYAVVRSEDVAGAADVERVLDAVIVGVDFAFDTERLAAAAAAVRTGSRFVATNVDARYPTPTGFRPGAGAMVDAIRDAAGVEPLVIGKPAPAMFQAILDATGVPAGEAMVVGDNPDADMVGARGAGIESVLVLTGVTDAAAAAALVGDRAPDHVAADPEAVWALIEARIRR